MWSLPSSLRCGSAGQGLPGCAEYPAWHQAGGWHYHRQCRCSLGSHAPSVVGIFDLDLFLPCPLPSLTSWDSLKLPARDGQALMGPSYMEEEYGVQGVRQYVVSQVVVPCRFCA